MTGPALVELVDGPLYTCQMISLPLCSTLHFHYFLRPIDDILRLLLLLSFFDAKYFYTFTNPIS